MCSVSAVMDYGKQIWLEPSVAPFVPTTPFPTLSKEVEAIQEFRKLVEAAKAFDKAADQTDCEDPEKVKLLERIDTRLKIIEEHLGLNKAVPFAL